MSTKIVYGKNSKVCGKNTTDRIGCQTRSSKEKSTPSKLQIPRKREAKNICSIEAENKEAETFELIENIFSNINEVTRVANKGEMRAAEKAGTQLIYGEILPEGINNLLDKDHCDVENALVLLDIGCGRGGLAIQCFEQFSLERVIGVELSEQRFDLASQALQKYVLTRKHKNLEQRVNMPMKYGTSTNHVVFEKSKRFPDQKRTLELYRGDIGKLKKLIILSANPDIVIMDVAFHSMPMELAGILNSLRPGTRLVTYENVAQKWPYRSRAFPFTEMAKGDRYLTSWADSGHPFYMWLRVPANSVKIMDERKSTVPKETWLSSDDEQDASDKYLSSSF